MLGQNRKLEKAAFARGILTTFGKLDECDIEKIDGRLERLISLLMQRYGWSDEFARKMIRESFPKKNSPNKLRSHGLGLIGRGIAVLGFVTRPRSPAGDITYPFSNASGPAAGINYHCDRVHHVDSIFRVKHPRDTSARSV